VGGVIPPVVHALAWFGWWVIGFAVNGPGESLRVMLGMMWVWAVYLAWCENPWR
jgi:hypothetical protein